LPGLQALQPEVYVPRVGLKKRHTAGRQNHGNNQAEGYGDKLNSPLDGLKKRTFKGLVIHNNFPLQLLLSIVA
jgi:hypothetical protein